jgi:serine/threonine protein kinase
MQEEYTEKADVWSLGCVLYHCMCLRPPFEGSNPLSVASKIVEGAYEPVWERGLGRRRRRLLLLLIISIAHTS